MSNSGVMVQRVGRTFMVIATLTSDEAREVAYALGSRDEAAKDLMAAADKADEQNGVTS